MLVLRSDACIEIVQGMWANMVLERPLTQAANGDAQDTVDPNENSTGANHTTSAELTCTVMLGDDNFTTTWYEEAGSR